MWIQIMFADNARNLEEEPLEQELNLKVSKI
jgi:hypothetical protein